MSVIVQGMDMPKSCAVCEYGAALTNNDYLCSRLFATGNINRYVNDGLKRPEWCPLVELPKNHGRLIDADAIDYDDYWYNKHYSIKDCQQAQRIIDEQPTVIESEE